MTAITLFNGVYCDADSVVKQVSDITGYRVVTDREIIAEAARLSGMSEEEIAGDFSSGLAGLGMGQPDHDRIISWLRFAMAQMLSSDQNLIFWGYSALLPAPDVDPILRVCLISDTDDRLSVANRGKEYFEMQALDHIRADDQARSDWTLTVTDRNDPWDERLYDLLIPVTATGIEQSAYMIVQQLKNIAPSEPSALRKTLDDFLLETKVQASLAAKGHDIFVSARNDALRLRFEDHRKALKQMSLRLQKAALEFEGVKTVEVGVGSQFDQNDIYQRVKPDTEPVLLQSGGHYKGHYEVTDVESPDECIEDLGLAVKMQNAFMHEGLDISVFVKNGAVSLTINNHKMMLEYLSRKLCEYVTEFDGVETVEVGAGKMYHRPVAYQRVRRNIAKSMLANDKRTFTPSLPELPTSSPQSTNAPLFNGTLRAAQS